MSSPAYAMPDESPTVPARQTVSAAWLVAMPIALHAILAWMLRARTIATGNDDAVYLLLARALRDGHYRELFYVGTPIHSQYPPGYPALLALLGAPADGGVALIIAVNILFSCAALALVFDVIRQWSLPIALVAAGVLAVNPSLIEAASRVQSEPMFMFAVLLALWALRPSAPVQYRWIAIAAAIVAALTRSAGIAVIAGLLAHFLVARAWRHAAALAIIALVSFGPWLAWTVLAPDKIVGRSYIADALVTVQRPGEAPTVDRSKRLEAPPRAVALARSLAFRVRMNIPRYFTRALPGELAVPTIPGTPIDNLAWLGIMMTALVAGVVAAWRRWRAALLVLVAYGGLLVVWPYAVNRFLTPLLPAFVAVLLLGAWRIGARLLPARMALVPALALAAIPLFGGARTVAAAIAGREDCPTGQYFEDGTCSYETPRYRQAVADLDTVLPANAHVFTSKEGTFYYLTGRRVVPLYPVVRYAAPELAAYLEEHRTTLIFLPHLKPEEEVLGPALAELCARLTALPSPDDELLILWNRAPAEGEVDGCGAVARWRATW